MKNYDPKVIDVLKCCLARDPSKRSSITKLLEHPYLKGEKKKGLGLDQLLSEFQIMSPNSQANFRHILKNGGLPPSYPNSVPNCLKQNSAKCFENHGQFGQNDFQIRPQFSHFFSKF